ncbi:hypothetical protein ACWU4D_00230 [Vibrio sp. WJH972]
MRDFEVIEKGEHYFRCYVDGIKERHCRIVVDENSCELPIGSFRLHVEDVSDRYKHGSLDTVFRMTLPFEQQDSIAICTLNGGRKNRFTYLACLKLGGKWEPILSEWVFSASVKDKVDVLGEIVHSKPVAVDVEFKETISEPKKDLTVFGFELIKGVRINNTPIFCKGVVLKKGDVSYIAGISAKTIVLAGSVIRLTVPEQMLESDFFKEDYMCSTRVTVVKTRKRKTR